MIDNDDPGGRREARVRNRAKRYRLVVCKSRSRTLHAKNRGLFQVTDAASGAVVAGPAFDQSLDAVERILDDRAVKQNLGPKKGRARPVVEGRTKA